MVLEFIPGLWIGNKNEKKNELFINEKGIDFIINCSDDLSFMGNKHEYNDTILKNIIRYRDIRFVDYLLKMTEFIYENIKENNNIFLYDSRNEDYTYVIILSYLIRYGNLDLSKSINIIRTKFIDAFNHGFNYKSVFSKFIKKI